MKSTDKDYVVYLLADYKEGKDYWLIDQGEYYQVVTENLKIKYLLNR